MIRRLSLLGCFTTAWSSLLEADPDILKRYSSIFNDIHYWQHQTHTDVKKLEFDALKTTETCLETFHVKPGNKRAPELMQSTDWKYSAFAKQGRSQVLNMDSFLVEIVQSKNESGVAENEFAAFAVLDGHGVLGHVVSDLVKNSLSLHLRDLLFGVEIPQPDETPAREQFVIKQLEEAFLRSQADLEATIMRHAGKLALSSAHMTRSLQQSGAVVTLVLHDLRGGNMFVSSVGDGNIFFKRAGHPLEQVAYSANVRHFEERKKQVQAALAMGYRFLGKTKSRGNANTLTYSYGAGSLRPLNFEYRVTDTNDELMVNWRMDKTRVTRAMGDTDTYWINHSPVTTTIPVGPEGWEYFFLPSSGVIAPYRTKFSHKKFTEDGLYQKIVEGFKHANTEPDKTLPEELEQDVDKYVADREDLLRRAMARVVEKAASYEDAVATISKYARELVSRRRKELERSSTLREDDLTILFVENPKVKKTSDISPPAAVLAV